MGRPKKQTVDYFPHFVTGSMRTKSILESRFGNDGYAFWFKLLELLCITDGHYFSATTVANREYLYSYTKVEGETADQLIELLVELENIDRELWEQHSIIWCQSLVDNLKGLYDKRTTPIPQKPFFGEKKRENPAKIVENDQSAPKTPPKKPKKPKEAEAPKIKYADYVSMTEEEYGKLVEKHGKDLTARFIEVLDNYKGSKGKTYKSDYRAILLWVIDKVTKEQEERGGGYGRSEIPAGNNRAPSTGAFKPSGGFKK